MPADLPEGVVTLLFTDLEGSTASATAMGEDAAHGLRQHHFALVREQVERHRGREIKTMGDGFMVAFTSTRRAVQCAIDIQRAVEREKRANASVLRVRIGLNAGEVMQDEDDLFGLMVNAAARIQALAAGGQILASESVRMLLGPASGIGFVDAGEHELKGFSEKWRLYDVPYSTVDERVDPRSVFVGRSSERTRLMSAYDRALTGRPSVVAISGEPGIGKTRLLAEFGERVKQRGGDLYWGRTDERSATAAYWPWVRAIRALTAERDLDQLRPSVERHAVDLVRVFPEVEQLVPGSVGRAADADAGGEVGRLRFFEALGAVLRAAALTKPFVLALDDVHWADNETLALMAHVAANLDRAPLLLVFTYRDSEINEAGAMSAALAELARVPGFETIQLRGLALEDVSNFLAQVQATGGGAASADAVHRRTGGNPFFLQEVVADFLRGSAVQIPESVKQAVQRRLTTASPACSEVLALAAILGRQFTFEALSAVADGGDDALLDQLEEAIDAGVVEDGERPGLYRFHHALVQETLLDGLSAMRQARMHARIAQALAVRYRDQPHRAGELAHHFAQCADLSVELRQQAIDWAVEAAQVAERQLAWSEAARLFERALALHAEASGAARLDEAQVLASLGRCQSAATDHRAAWRSLNRAIDQLRERGDWDAQARATLDLLTMWAPPQRRMQLIDAALAARGERSSALQAQLLANKASLLGPSPAGLDVAGRARALLAANPNRAAEAQLAVFDTAADHADIDGTIELLTRAFADLDALGLVDAALDALNSRHSLAIETGSIDRFLALAEPSIRYARRYRRKLQETVFAGDAAATWIDRCDVERARALIASIPERAAFTYWTGSAAVAEFTGESLPALRAEMPDPSFLGGVPSLTANYCAIRVRIAFAAGDLDAANAEVAVWEEMDAAWSADRFVPGHNVPLLGTGVAQLASVGAVERTYTFLQGLPWLKSGFWGSVDRLRGELALRLDTLDAAERHFRDGVMWCERERLPVEGARCRDGLAAVHQKLGDKGAARAELAKSMAIYERYGTPVYTAWARERLAGLS